MILIDMHVHSICSDGTLTVESIVRTARKRHLALISLTDHDTTSGIPSFMSSCRANGVAGLPGIELSAASSHTLHILGYRIDPGNADLERRLKDVREHRNSRNHEICERLRGLGFDIRIEDVMALSNGQVVARPHIARLMIQRGYASTFGEAFAKYIGAGGSAYVPRVRLSAEECISLVNGAGGLAVLAHPAQTGLGDDEFRGLVGRLKDAGLWGIEAVYSGHSSEQMYKYLSVADEFGLFSTAGSDFHGGCGHVAEIGLPVSENFLPWARLGVKI